MYIPLIFVTFDFVALRTGFLAIVLTIYVRLVTTDTIAVSTVAFWTVNGILAIGLLAIVVVLGMQSNGNAIFTMNFSHPMPPAIVLLAQIYLCTAIDVAAWIRFAVWMAIGKMNFVNPSRLSLSLPVHIWMLFLCVCAQNAWVGQSNSFYVILAYTQRLNGSFQVPPYRNSTSVYYAHYYMTEMYNCTTIKSPIIFM